MSSPQTHAEMYKKAFDAALVEPENAIDKALPALQRDAIREDIRRRSALGVDTVIRSAAFGAFLPDDDAKKLAQVYPRLSLKGSVVKAAAEAYAAHGLDVEKIDAAIERAMSSNRGKKDE